MNKRTLDNSNTVYSHEWHHKGYIAFLNSSDICAGERYYVARPDEQNAFAAVKSQVDAVSVIETDIASRSAN